MILLKCLLSSVSPETIRKLCLSTILPHEEIRWNYDISRSESLREKCPNTELLLVRIFLYFPVFSPNTGKYGPEKSRYLYNFYAVNVIMLSQIVDVHYLFKYFNPFLYNVKKWPNTLLKYCRVNTRRFLKYTWLLCNIMQESV